MGSFLTPRKKEAMVFRSLNDLILMEDEASTPLEDLSILVLSTSDVMRAFSVINWANGVI